MPGRGCPFSIARELGSLLVSTARSRKTSPRDIWNVSQIDNRREIKVNGSVVKTGASAPLGATVFPGGVNFSVFSKNAS